MPILNSLFGDNKFVQFAAVFAAMLVAALIVYLLWRLAFGSRLHLSGGRQRQPRLGVVDAYDLDRQRQLVLVRRDNVEHLIMIGGPNDVVIESAILRAQTPLMTREAAAPAIPAELAESSPAPRPVVMPVQPQVEPAPRAAVTPAKSPPPPPPAPPIQPAAPAAFQPAPARPAPPAGLDEPPMQDVEPTQERHAAQVSQPPERPRLDDIPAFLVEPRRTAVAPPPPPPVAPAPRIQPAPAIPEVQPAAAPPERVAPAIAAPAMNAPAVEPPRPAAKAVDAAPAPSAPKPPVVQNPVAQNPVVSGQSPLPRLPAESARLISSLEDEMARLLGRPPKT